MLMFKEKFDTVLQKDEEINWWVYKYMGNIVNYYKGFSYR